MLLLLLGGGGGRPESKRIQTVFQVNKTNHNLVTYLNVYLDKLKFQLFVNTKC